MPRKPRSPRANPLFSEAFQGRIKTLRLGVKMSQGEMAKALGISVDAYKKYETRDKSVLPHHLLPRFVDIVGGNPSTYHFLFTGRLSEPESARAKRHARNRR